MAATKIEWSDAVWNPVRGCALVSPGCTNCYAMRQAHRTSGPGGAYAGLTTMTKGGPMWTGAARTVPELYDAPLHWKTPRRIFVNSMSDLFHERIDFEHVAAIFGVMASAPQHTFQVLTKRPARALEFFHWIENDADGATQGCVLHAREILGLMRYGLRYEPDENPPWPLPNVWLGVSVEDQRRADERIPLLQRTPAAVRWISAEPLLEAIDLTNIRTFEEAHTERGHLHELADLDWVVVGGESGPGARAFRPEWARSIIKQCRRAGVPVFVKQMGSYVVDRNDAGFDGCEPESWPLRPDGCDPDVEHDIHGFREEYQGADCRIRLVDRKGGDPQEWPEDLRVREYPRA